MAIHRAANLMQATAPPQNSGRRSYTLAGIPEGVEGTIVTLDIMRRFVRMERTNPRIIELARSIVAGLPGKAFEQEAASLQNWVRENIRYTQDVTDVETLQTPSATLELGQGDCDDQAMLLAALLHALGHEARFVAVGMIPDTFEHVLVETKIGSEWYPAETTEPMRLGEYPWSAGEVLTKMIRSI